MRTLTGSSSKTRNKFYQLLHTLGGAIALITLTNKETRAKTLKEFKRCRFVKFDTDKMTFEPILATIKNKDIGYEYF